MPALHHKHPSIASPSPSSSFPLFTFLPHEIASEILLLASRSPKSSCKHPSKRSPLSLDISTTLSLTLTSKSINKIITPLLFNAVRITRPSALLEILSTLEERPALGKLIRHLHVGDDYTLYQDESDWPLLTERIEDSVRLEFPVLWLRTSWAAGDEDADAEGGVGGGGKLPRWCEPGRSWCLEPWRLDCKGRAVVGAIERALQGVDVQPYRRGYAKSGKKIGVERWAVRIYELQACLDLYLTKMRRIEHTRNYPVQHWRTVKPGPPQDPHICRLGECGHYPHFALGGGEDGEGTRKKKKKESSKNTFTVTRTEIWKHLARRGGALDQFDHPIRFAKSGSHLGRVASYGRSAITNGLYGPNRSSFTPQEYDPQSLRGEGDSEEEDNSVAAISADWPHANERGKTSGALMASPYFVQGLIATVDRLLTLTSEVVNLSLSGYLHLCLFVMPIPLFDSVRSLCLGPLLPFWDAGVIGFDGVGPMVSKVENLRIAGTQLVDEEILRVAGVGGRGLMRLKRFEFELVQTINLGNKCVPNIPAKHIYEQICQLQGQGAHGKSKSTHPGLIEVRLHPSDVPVVLSLAPTSIRSAWQNGSPIPGAQHRVRVVASGAAAAAYVSDGEDDGDEKAKRQKKGIKMLHRESRRWWEECAAGERRSGGIWREGWMPNARAS